MSYYSVNRLKIFVNYEDNTMMGDGFGFSMGYGINFWIFSILFIILFVWLYSAIVNHNDAANDSTKKNNTHHIIINIIFLLEKTYTRRHDTSPNNHNIY